jgi:protein TonB
MSFEAFLTQTRPPPNRRRRLTYALSLAVHGALLVIAVVRSSWHTDELSAPQIPLTFLSLVPPPAPPPPIARRQASSAVRRRPADLVPQRRIAAPPEEKESVESAAADDGAGDEHGIAAGTPAGVPGGTGIAPGPAPATFLPPSVATGRLAIDPQSDPYVVRLPPPLARAGMTLWAMVRICVKPSGQVAEVKILQGADPVVDPIIVATLGTWRYRPFTIDGRPVPFCTNVRYVIAAR